MSRHKGKERNRVYNAEPDREWKLYENYFYDGKEGIRMMMVVVVVMMIGRSRIVQPDICIRLKKII